MSIYIEYSYRVNDQTALEIKQYGFSVVIVEATNYLPSFAYTIGLWDTYKHPEIICFGLAPVVMNSIVRDIARSVKDGKVIKVDSLYDDIFETGTAAFVNVDSSSITHYFATAVDYHRTNAFPAVQLVWTDRNDKFPWQDGFEEKYLYMQPLLDRNMDFKFREERNLGVLTTRQWLESGKPILYVIHDEEGDWQFLTGDPVVPSDAKLVSLESLASKDRTLNEVFDLGYGEQAIREYVGGPWKRTRAVIDEE